MRLIASGSTPKPDALARTGTVVDASQARTGSRPVYFGTDFVDSPVYDGAALGPGATIEGPAIVEEPFTVVVLAPGNVARLDRARQLRHLPLARSVLVVVSRPTDG